MSTRVEISKRLVAINSASSVATRALSVSVLVWLNQYLLRRISPEEYSLYPVIMAVMVFVPLLTTVLTSGLGRYLVEAYAKNDERRVTQIVSTMFPLLLTAGITLLVLGLTFSWQVDHVLTIAPGRVWDARIMMALMMCSAAISLWTSVFGAGLYVRQKFVLANCIQLGVEFLRIAILLVLLLGVSTRVLWVVLASVSANLVGVVVTITISMRLVPSLRFCRNEIVWSLAKNLTTFGAWNFVGQLANTIRSASDVLILNKLGTPLDVTCYHLGSFPQRQIDQMIGVVHGPLTPALTAMHALKESDRLRNVFLRGGRYTLWATLFLVVPACVYRQEIITLYLGEKYLTASVVMVLLLMLYPIGGGHSMVHGIAHATARVGLVVRWVVFIQMINLCLTLYLVGVLRMGAVGSALSTFLTNGILAPVLIAPLALRMASVNIGTWLRDTVCPGLLPGLVTAGFLVCLRMLCTPNSWLLLGIYAGLGFLCYMIVLFGVCLQPCDRCDLGCSINKIKNRFASLN